MYDDILGPVDEEIEKKPKNRINLKNKVCYDCGNIYEECECEEGFSMEDLDLDEEESKMTIDENDCDEADPWDGADDCGEDDCVGCIEPSQDINTIHN